MNNKDFEKLQERKIALMERQNNTLVDIKIEMTKMNERMQGVETNTNHMGDRLTELGGKTEALKGSIDNTLKIIRWILYVTLISLMITGAVAGIQITLPPSPFG